jgi:FkbM family methyltransferase
MIVQQLKTAGRSLMACGQAVGRKSSVLASGRSAVSATCQIPKLREKYVELGLDPRRGTFVEIGGFDGEKFSNSSFLADQGWRGVYVEPVGRFARMIKLRHAFNAVAVENVAIAANAGTAGITVMDSLTTMHEPTAQLYDELPWAQKTSAAGQRIEIKTDTLGAVLGRNAVPANLELMIVDVEGGEEPIIASLLASHWKPRVLIVELVDLHNDFALKPELQASAGRTRAMILAGGYRAFYSDLINSIFVRDERSPA